MSTPEQKKLLPTLRAGSVPAGIVPTNFDDCYRIAKLLSASGMVPNDYRDKPEAACVAIMQGLEVGLPPMAALQSIAVINGRPSIWGDGALGLVRASGLLESIRETDDGKEATCEVKRKDEPEPIVRKFSQADAQRDGLLRVKEGKQPGPWHTYPHRMRQMRARSWALRDGFADVLKGLHIAEEARDIPTIDVTPNRAIAELPDIPDAPQAKPDDPAPITDEPAPVKRSTLTDEQFMDALDASYATANDLDSLNEHMTANELEIEERGLEQACAQIYSRHMGRIYDRMK